MEQMSNIDDTQKLHQIIRKVSGELSTQNDTVRDASGGFLGDKSANVERWREHFEHLFTPAPFRSHLQRSLLPPSEGDVTDAIKRLRNKASANDVKRAEIKNFCADTGSMNGMSKSEDTRSVLMPGAQAS
ncbi:unnamed protein product [Dibothriocephalus latus]|uniref:Uncharacterized protein n=1 Tax=Dibothriocephalus latus TaxID=60516 RepID=A0A3P7MJB0_DIBLA|nr:unnamed protein product [Dibothriocephalus latus]